MDRLKKKLTRLTVINNQSTKSMNCSHIGGGSSENMTTSVTIGTEIHRRRCNEEKTENGEVKHPHLTGLNMASGAIIHTSTTLHRAKTHGTRPSVVVLSRPLSV